MADRVPVELRRARKPALDGAPPGRGARARGGVPAVSTADADLARLRAMAPSRRAGAVGGLQGVVGNHGVQRVLAGRAPVPTPRMSRPGDREERDAERLAGRAIAGLTGERTLGAAPVPPPGAASEIPARTREGDDGNPVHTRGRDAVTDGSVTAAASLIAGEAGAPLPAVVRRLLEPAFRADFSMVRIHASERAAAAADRVRARAFTLGTHLVFARGEHPTSTGGDLRLVAHELAHVVQQSGHGNRSPERSGGAVLLRQAAGGHRAEVQGHAQERGEPGPARVRFDPQLAEAEAAAQRGIEAGRLVLKTAQALSKDQLAQIQRQLDELAAETGIPADELAFLKKRGLHQAVGQSLGLLDDVIHVARLEEHAERWRHEDRELLVLIEGASTALAVTSVCLTVIGGAAGALQGAMSGGVGALKGALALLTGSQFQTLGKVLGVAGSVLGAAHGAYSIATASTDEEAVAGAIGFGTGVGGISGVAAGSLKAAGLGLGWGLAAGGYFAVAQRTLSSIPSVLPGTAAVQVDRSLRTLAVDGHDVAKHANWVQEALTPWYDLLQSSRAVLEAGARQRIVWASRHLAHSLSQLLARRPGAVNAVIRDYLVEAADGPGNIPSADDVESVQMGLFQVADGMLETARRVLSALERLFFDPAVRSEVIAKGAREQMQR